MFTKYYTIVVVVALPVILSMHGAHAKTHLRAPVENTDSATSTRLFGSIDVPDRNLRESALDGMGKYELLNNCGRDITDFDGVYNINFNGGVLNQQSVTNEGKVLKNGDTITIEDADPGTYLHFFGLYTSYDFVTGKWDVEEIANGPTLSNRFARPRYNGVDFAMHMVKLEGTRIKLCFNPPKNPEPEPRALRELTVVNNCGRNINHFVARYNHRLEDDKILFDEWTDEISDGESIVIEDVDDESTFHFYALYVERTKSYYYYYGGGSVYRWKCTTLDEIGYAPQLSNLYRNSRICEDSVRWWMVDNFGDDMIVELCPTN